MRLAIFDLDNTLLAGDSDHAWGEFLVAEGLVDPVLHKARNDGFYADYCAGKLDIFAYSEFVFSFLVDKEPSWLAALHRRFMENVIEPMVLPKAVDLVESCVVDIGGCVGDGSLALDGDVGDFGLTSSGHSAAATALAAADDLVVVSSCEPANVARLLSNVSAIRSLAPSARMHVVINRVRTPIVRNEAAAEELREFVAMHIDAAHVLLVAEDRTTMDAATARGLTPLEQNRKCAFIRDLVPLVRELSSPVVASR